MIRVVSKINRKVPAVLFFKVYQSNIIVNEVLECLHNTGKHAMFCYTMSDVWCLFVFEV